MTGINAAKVLPQWGCRWVKPAPVLHQASCWSMNAVSWDLLMAPTLVAAS